MLYPVEDVTRATRAILTRLALGEATASDLEKAYLREFPEEASEDGPTRGLLPFVTSALAREGSIGIDWSSGAFVLGASVFEPRFVPVTADTGVSALEAAARFVLPELELQEATL